MFESEKSEEATPKRRQDAINKGNAAKSMDLSIGIKFILAIFMLRALALPAWNQLESLTINAWRHFPTDVSADQANDMMQHYSLQMLTLLAPILLGMLFFGVATSVIQTGIIFNPALLRVDISRVNPFGQSGFPRFFSAQPYQSLIVNILKLTALGWLGWTIVLRGYPKLIDTVHMDLAEAGSTYAALVWEVCWKVGMALLILGVVDYVLAKRRFDKSIKMSKQEVKDENRSQDGDPAVKGRQRQLRMQASRKRMMQDVPRADVVITNPTHLAIAIEYNVSKMGAPTVIAMGADHLAKKIREIAKENNVPIIENKPLAQALYRDTEIGDEIPSELYAAVSDILVYVFRLSGKMSL
ncbi:MAG: EscU/YscU/HrcU family type III secretion system export apparatus switch protein [Candidatus Sericytochromatia bacterium]|nr:EscU/YscU/HrcU family type III secretion system export apparatus switch protein [Candidatus Sericytochromatia bacterium]